MLREIQHELQQQQVWRNQNRRLSSHRSLNLGPFQKVLASEQQLHYTYPGLSRTPVAAYQMMEKGEVRQCNWGWYQVEARRRQFRAPKIDVTKPDSLEHSPMASSKHLPPKLGCKEVSPTAVITGQGIEEQFDEDGEENPVQVLLDLEDEDVEEHDLHQGPIGAADLAAEVAIIVPSPTYMGRAPAAPPTSQVVPLLHLDALHWPSTACAINVLDTSSVVDAADEPGTSDDFCNKPPQNDRQPTGHIMSKKGKQRQVKLQQEAPTVSQGQAVSWSKRTLAKAQHASEAAMPSGAQGPGAVKPPWLHRTDITPGLTKVSRNTWGININSLLPPMSEVVRGTMATGKIYIAFGLPGYAESDDPPYMIFEDTRPASFAIDTLISDAEAKGLDGEYDVAHRLEEGSEIKYINPLCNYVAHCLRAYRGAIKDAARDVIPTLLKFSTTPTQELQALLTDSNFLFPRLSNGVVTQRHDYSQPFRGEGFVDLIHAAFFKQKQYRNIGLKNSRLPDEKEIPATMLALAATAVSP
ncbi:hypothetical protein BD413DRAFT_494506 [Trametes elegans]|nr:hypothetical protein BD413DRAFT_494506 [Trametes elegans]